MRKLVQRLQRYMRRRLSPEGFFGLYFTAGCIVMLVAGAFFGDITEDILTGDPMTQWDYRVADWFHSHSTPGETEVMSWITFFGSPAWLFGVGFLVLLIVLSKKLYYHLLLLLAALPGGMGICVLLKMAIHRNRPAWSVSLFDQWDYSFPSGHAMGATLLYGSIAVFAIYSLRGTLAKTMVILILIAAMLIIGFSRIYLTVHYFSDVTGGLVAGLVWLTFCATLIEFVRKFRIDKAKHRET